MTKPNPSAVEALLEEGAAQLEAALTFAKAASGGASLESDFKDLNAAKKKGATDEDDEDKDDEDKDDEDEQDPSSDEMGEGGEGGDPDSSMEGQKPAAKMAKAAPDEGDLFVDAAPILESIQAALLEQSAQLAKAVSEIGELRAQNLQLAKAVQGGLQAQLTTLQLAKADQGKPLMPKSQVRVPTGIDLSGGASKFDANTVLAKAEQAIYDGKMSAIDMSTLATYIKTMGVDAAVAQMSPHAQTLLSA